MTKAEVPSWMYEQLEALRGRVKALEEDVMRSGNGPRLVTAVQSEDALETARRQLLEHEVMLASFEKASDAQRT